MTLSDDRRAMLGTLQDLLVPELRALGFKGSLPKFYRLRDGHVDLVSFQFHKYGGSFVVELAYVGPKGENYYGHLMPAPPPRELSVGGIRDRLRLNAGTSHRDQWFAIEGLRDPCQASQREKVAHQVINLLYKQGVPWWDEKKTSLESKPSRLC